MLTKTVEGTKVCSLLHTHTRTCSHIRHHAHNGNFPNLQRKSEDYYAESPGDTFSSKRFQIRTISLKYHVEYEVRVFEVAQVRKTLRYACRSQGVVIVILLVISQSLQVYVNVLSVCAGKWSITDPHLGSLPLHWLARLRSPKVPHLPDPHVVPCQGCQGVWYAHPGALQVSFRCNKPSIHPMHLLCPSPPHHAALVWDDQGPSLLWTSLWTRWLLRRQWTSKEQCRGWERRECTWFRQWYVNSELH